MVTRRGQQSEKMGRIQKARHHPRRSSTASPAKRRAPARTHTHVVTQGELREYHHGAIIRNARVLVLVLVCVCARERACLGACLRVRACVWACVCVPRVCVCVQRVCLCMCVRVRYVEPT